MKDCGCGGSGTKSVSLKGKGFGMGSATGKKLSVTSKKSRKATRVTVGKNK